MTRFGFLITLSIVFSCGTLLADTLTYDFDDGTFQGWDYITPEGTPFPVDDSDSGWIASDEPIDINDGFTLLAATSGDFRVVPDPWSTRDCLGATICYTQVLRSPPFELGASGDLTIDMMGGGAQSNRPYDPEVDLLPEEPEDMMELKDSLGYQGFGLLDIDANEYVAFGFSSRENDGKARPDDPVTRKDWETVAIPEAELASFANDGKQYSVDIFDSYAGGWAWIGFDTVKIPIAGAAGEPGDFNANGVLDGDDIEALSAAVRDGATDSQWDVDGNSLVNNDDRLFWVNDLKMTYLGDSNLDGEFNSSDFVAVFAKGQYEDAIPNNSTWSDGDWNGDSDFDSSDFVAAFAAGGYEKGARVPAAALVPEPASATGLLLGIIGLLLSSRRRK